MTQRKSKKKSNSSTRELILKDSEQEYGKVIKKLGNGRFEIFCFDGETRLCRIRGSLRRRCKIEEEDIVLIALRDFQPSKADIIGSYTSEEVRLLTQLQELPSTEETRVNENVLFFDSKDSESIDVDLI